jgi:hypothetical protein
MSATSNHVFSDVPDPGYAGAYSNLPKRSIQEWLNMLQYAISSDIDIDVSRDGSIENSSCDARNDGKYRELRSVVDADVQAFIRTLHRRYGTDELLIQDRLKSYMQVVQQTHAIAKAAGLSSDTKIVLIASPGRDRLFMGHTDFAGLGGFTVDAATCNEIVATLFMNTRSRTVCDRTSPQSQSQSQSQSQRLFNDNGVLKLFNMDPAFPETEVCIQQVIETASDSSNYGKQCYDPQHWSSYIKGALTYMFSDKFAFRDVVCKRLGVQLQHEQQQQQQQQRNLDSQGSNNNTQSQIHSSKVNDNDMRDSHEGESNTSSSAVTDLCMVVSSEGVLALPSSGGVSSSASLTGRN